MLKDIYSLPEKLIDAVWTSFKTLMQTLTVGAGDLLKTAAKEVNDYLQQNPLCLEPLVKPIGLNTGDRFYWYCGEGAVSEGQGDYVSECHGAGKANFGPKESVNATNYIYHTARFKACIKFS